MGVKEQIEDRLLRWACARSSWTLYRARQLHKEYCERRERYAAEAARRGLTYREGDLADRVRERVHRRGYGVRCSRMGDIHTFAAVPIHAWHEHLMPDLREFGPVSHFDYIREGFSCSEFSSAKPGSLARRRSLHNALLQSLAAAHKRRPIDWAFFYGGAPEVTPSLMQAIEHKFGIPTVNMSLDDKQAFEGEFNGECRSGVVDVTRFFDLYITPRGWHASGIWWKAGGHCICQRGLTLHATGHWR